MSLAKSVQQAMDRSAEHGGVAGQLISDAVKKENLNAPAFRIAHRLLRLGGRDPLKLRTLLDDLDYYRTKMDLDKLAGDSLFERAKVRRTTTKLPKARMPMPTSTKATTCISFPARNAPPRNTIPCPTDRSCGAVLE